MKLIGFSQLRNERAKGNLENWLKCMEICDYTYVVDQNSDDGSEELYKQTPKLNVTYNESNDFVNEILHKKILLKKLLSDHPDTDWIFWMDGDTLLDGRVLNVGKEGFEQVIKLAETHGSEAVSLNHFNLWRSDIHFRVDNSYHGLRPVCLWKNTGNLDFPDAQSGLHLTQYPQGINKIGHCNELGLIHRGFATDEQIILKYDIYKERGQNGWALDRLLDESTLAVGEIPRELLPNWFTVKDCINPTVKRKIIDIYNNE